MSKIKMDMITSSCIKFENIEQKYDPLIPELFPEDTHLLFGTLKIKVADIPMTKTPQFILFTNDCSGSMADICSDGRSKMEHSNQTICNIMKMLAMYEEAEIWIKVNAFDDIIYEIIEFTRVTPNNVLELINKVNQIIPRNSTNLELALKSTTFLKSYYEGRTKSFAENGDNNYNEVFGSCFAETFSKGGRKITHILTTDGNTLKGCTDDKILASYVNTDIDNIFIGFGTDHSAETLLSLASNKNARYYFIDNIENGGIVFAEIIHTILYKCITDIQIEAIHSELYDFELGIWTNILYIDSLPGDVEKTYHIRTSKSTYLDDIEVYIMGTALLSDPEQYQNKVLDVVFNPTISIDSNPDIIKYIFRQRTLELLYQARKNQIEYTYSEQKKTKVQLKSFLESMKKYMNQNTLEKDPFYQSLCDDIYITLKTLGTNYGNMFISSRGKTNGHEYSYNTSTIPEQNTKDDDSNSSLKPKIVRQTSSHALSDSEPLNNQTNCAMDILNHLVMNTCYYSKEEDEELYWNHKTNASQINSFNIPPKVIEMIRCISEVMERPPKGENTDPFLKGKVEETSINNNINKLA